MAHAGVGGQKSRNTPSTSRQALASSALGWIWVPKSGVMDRRRASTALVMPTKSSRVR